MTIRDKTALITGGSKGLGLALAHALAGAGWNLLINGRNETVLNEATFQLRAVNRGLGNQIIPLAGDINAESHRIALARAAADLGGLDLLVNNAGALGPSPMPELLSFPLKALADLFQTNLIAQLGVIQALQHQVKSNATIINISSDAAVEAYPGWGGYGASKAAFEQLSAVLAAENDQWRIYTVDPGDMRTDMHQAAFPGEDISDRPLPTASVPGFLSLVHDRPPSGRYQARALVPTTG